jgi:hypothetical protein
VNILQHWGFKLWHSSNTIVFFFLPFHLDLHLWEKFLHIIFANISVENQEHELCTTTSNELWFFSMCVFHSLPNSKQSNSLKIASKLRWVHLLVLLLACFFARWHYGLMKLICEFARYIFMKRKMSWLIVVIDLSKW